MSDRPDIKAPAEAEQSKDSGLCFRSELWVNTKDMDKPHSSTGSGDYTYSVINQENNAWHFTNIFQNGKEVASQRAVHDTNFESSSSWIFETDQGEKGKYYRIDGNQPQYGDDGKPATAGSNVAEVTPNAKTGGNDVRDVAEGSKEFNRVQELGIKYFARPLPRCSDR